MTSGEWGFGHDLLLRGLWYFSNPDLREEIGDFDLNGEDGPTEEELKESAAEVQRREEAARLFREQAEELF